MCWAIRSGPNCISVVSRISFSGIHECIWIFGGMVDIGIHCGVFDWLEGRQGKVIQSFWQFFAKSVLSLFNKGGKGENG